MNPIFTAAIVVSVVILLSFCIGCVGFYLGLGPDRGNRTMGLIVFNWSLLVTSKLFTSCLDAQM